MSSSSGYNGKKSELSHAVWFAYIQMVVQILYPLTLLKQSSGGVFKERCSTACNSSKRLAALLHEVRGFACGLVTNHEGHPNREKELVEYFLSHAMARPPSKPFSKMQQLAELRRFGTRPADVPASCTAVGSLLHVLYMHADSGSPSGREIFAVLQCSVAENGLANDLFKRVPELDEDFQALVQQVCRGFFDVEEILLSTDWGALDLGTTLPLFPLLPPLAFGGSGPEVVCMHFTKKE